MRQLLVATALLITQAGCIIERYECNTMYVTSGLWMDLEDSPVLLDTDWVMDLDMSFEETTGVDPQSLSIVLSRETLGEQLTATIEGGTYPIILVIDEDLTEGRVHSLLLEGTAPSLLDVLMREGDAVISEGRFTPDYEVSEPNGEGCGEHFNGEIELPITL